MKTYTCEEVAEIYKCHIATIRKLCREGKIAAMKPGKHWLITKKALYQYIDTGIKKQQNDAAQAVIDNRSLKPCQFTKMSTESGRFHSACQAAKELDNLLKPKTNNLHKNSTTGSKVKLGK